LGVHVVRNHRTYGIFIRITGDKSTFSLESLLARSVEIIKSRRGLTLSVKKKLHLEMKIGDIGENTVLKHVQSP
jgi:hypothetical protein